MSVAVHLCTRTGCEGSRGESSPTVCAGTPGLSSAPPSCTLGTHPSRLLSRNTNLTRVSWQDEQGRLQRGCPTS